MKKLTQEEFIEKSKEKHNNFYTYNKTSYIKTSEKVLITCPIHKNFEQTPASHLRGSGCPECGKLITRKSTTKDFIEKAKEIHGNKYEYSLTEYAESKNKVIIICSNHGEFRQKASSHLAGYGCKKCAVENAPQCNLKAQEQFIDEAKKIHCNKYTYENTIYNGSKEKVIIECRIHGNFTQVPSSHLQGKGCAKCNYSSQGGRYSKKEYVKKANGRVCTFYILRCFSDEEEFYKIGMTMKTVKQRYNSKTAMPYLYEIISEVYGEAGLIWELEKQEVKRLKENHYLPNMAFSGSKTECFTNYKLE